MRHPLLQCMIEGCTLLMSLAGVGIPALQHNVGVAQVTQGLPSGCMDSLHSLWHAARTALPAVDGNSTCKVTWCCCRQPLINLQAHQRTGCNKICSSLLPEHRQLAAWSTRSWQWIVRMLQTCGASGAASLSRCPSMVRALQAREAHGSDVSWIP